MSSIGDPGRIRLRINGHGIATYPAGATFGPRTLRDFEFVWIIDGEVVWTADGDQLPAPAGTLLLGRPGMRDGFVWDPRRQTRHGYVHFGVSGGGEALPSVTDWPLARRFGDRDVLPALLDHLIWLLGQPDAHQLAVHALRHALAVFITGASGAAASPAGDVHPLVERAFAHVQRRWAQGRLIAPTLDELAAAAGVSRAHLSRVFQRELGATPVEAFRLMRLDRAAAQLARTNLPVQRIADACGFDNAFHFSRVFAAAYGRSPRAFRARMLAGGDMPTIRLVQVRRMGARLVGGDG